MKSILEADVSGKKVIVWTDLDVPVESGVVTDDTRLKASAKTVNYLKDKKASVLMIGHLGRPKGRDPLLSFQLIANKLETILNSKVEIIDEIKTPQTSLVLLENIRFWPEEEKKDQKFVKQIAKLGDIYVNDCFATSHHAGATMIYLPKLLPSFAGINLLKEVQELGKVFDQPARPLVAIIAGAKLETKLPAIYNLAKVADTVLVGGKLMFEADRATLPENVLIAHDDVDGKDIGPKSIGLFRGEINKAKTIVWNGTLGVYEKSKYMSGTAAVAAAVVDSQAYRVVGGGDTIAALNKLLLIDKINFVSTGGGAMLEFLGGKKLPGLAALGYYD
ncbi:MAG: phosphoglycerate kinase [bacterium]|nr:phosphoglycerate kinase [bacterium]